MNYIFILGRVLLGGFFINSGIGHFKNMAGLVGYAGSKKVPFPKVAVILSGLMLLLGGAGIVFEYNIKLALFLEILFIIPTTIMMHQFWKIEDPMQKMGDRINFFKNLAILGSLLMLFALAY